MGAPQIIYLTLVGVGLLLSAYLHGKPKRGTENVFVTLVGQAMMVALLWWGGFFG